MAFEIKKATRKDARIKVALFGPPGSGKTMSALKLARGLCDAWEEICVIDTENNSASLYSELGGFSVIEMEPPYSPKRYVEAINQVMKDPAFKVLIIDTASHEWNGPGGCLEMVDSFGDWKTVTPQHNEFIGAITGSPKFVIGCMRSKMEYVITDTEKNGKKSIKVEKVGLKAEQRDNAPYEFGLTFVMDSQTKAHVDKDRTQLFTGLAPFQITEATGDKIRKWNDSGTALTAVEKFQIEQSKKVFLVAKPDELKCINELPDEIRVALKQKGYRGMNEVAHYFRSKDWDIEAVKYELGLIAPEQIAEVEKKFEEVKEHSLHELTKDTSEF